MTEIGCAFRIQSTWLDEKEIRVVLVMTTLVAAVLTSKGLLAEVVPGVREQWRRKMFDFVSKLRLLYLMW